MTPMIAVGGSEVAVQQGFGSLDETALIRSAQRGDHSAFEALVCRYDQAVLRLALHLTGSEHDAQDVYQQAFMKAYKSIGRFRFQSSFHTWIHRIVTNLCLDQLRSKRVRKEEPQVRVDWRGEEFDQLSQVADAHPRRNPERALLQGELRARIEMALERLTPRERMIFELKHYRGLRLRAVGEIMNTGEDTVKSTLYRATRKLRLILADMH